LHVLPQRRRNTQCESSNRPLGYYCVRFASTGSLFP
jgi:hypothetical protein